jgi:L-ascorbate metabolism protein UlaG (beta-lactamase superfamily)
MGHGSMRIDLADQALLIDPWLTGNPMIDSSDWQKVTQGASHVLLTHGHGDHSADVIALAQEKSIPLVGIYDLMSALEAAHGITTIGFNMSGTVRLGDVAVTMVPAMHSNTFSPDPALPAGREAGFILQGEGRCIYVSGDTGVMADMDWIGDYFKPDVGILSAGGHFTMDMKAAAYAAKRYFDFMKVIPVHYRTFDLLEQSADALVASLPGVDVLTPQVLETVTL